MNLQQSSLYCQYIQALKWTVVTVDGVHMFVRRFPIIGGLAKIQRSHVLPDLKMLLPVLREHHVRTLAVEPEYTTDETLFRSWCQRASRHVRLNRTPFLPTKTIVIDLTPTEEKIFQKFSEAKRRAVRKAQKNNLQICRSANIQDLIHIKNKSTGLFGFITTSGIDKLWNIFAPKRAAILLAYSSSRVVGGLLLLFYDSVAYYWLAGATREGKKLVAPTLLVWEALKLSKQRGCKRFDFVGVWDERVPRKFSDWKGFTKFKEGFGGKPLYYPTLR